MSKPLAIQTINAIKTPSENRANPKLRRLLALSGVMVLLIAVTGIFFCKYNRIAVGGSPKLVLLLTISAILLVTILAILYALIISKRIKSESLVYFGTLVTCGLVFCFLFIPGSVPDEGSHYASSYKYANMLMGIEPSEDSTSMRETDHELFASTMRVTLSGDAYRETVDAATPTFIESNSRTYYSDSKHLRGSIITTSMANSPQMRLAPSLGLICGQLLGLNGLWTFYLGRIFNLLWFSILGVIAFRITPIAKPAFIAVTLLPMTLHLAASYSYDPSAIGLALVLTALCLKARYSTGKVANGTLALIIATAFLLAPCKVVYSIMVLIIFAIPKSKFNNKKTCYLFRIAVLAGAFAGIIIFSIPNLIYISGINEGAGLESTTSEGGQTKTMTDLVSNPIDSLFIYLNTIYTHGTFYLNSFIGGSLGWFQAELAAPHLFLIAYGAILLMSVQKTPEDGLTINRKTKLLIAFTCLIVFVGVLTSLYLDWTPIYEYVIQGVQGRYFLPCGALLLLFRVNRYTTAIQLKTSVPLCMYGLNMMYAIFILAAALRVV